MGANSLAVASRKRVFRLFVLLTRFDGVPIPATSKKGNCFQTVFRLCCLGLAISLPLGAIRSSALQRSLEEEKSQLAGTIYASKQGTERI